MTNIEKSIAKLQRCFPGSYITDRNEKYMRDGINAFLDTDFSEDDMELIYTYMGLACDRWLTLMFIDHDMSIEWLKEHVS